MEDEDQEITHPRAILCEGAGDAAFLKHLISSRDLHAFYITYPTHIDPKAPGGRDGYTVRLRALRLMRGFSKVTDLVVMADNDDNPAKKFKTVQTLIQAAGSFPIPTATAEMAGGSPRVGIYMLPAAGIPGQLETLCLESSVAKWPARSLCMEDFVACNPHFVGWDAGKLEKMRMRVMLSSICATDPYTSLQHAWSRPGYEVIPLEHACFDPLVAFLASIAPELPLTTPATPV